MKRLSFEYLEEQLTPRLGEVNGLPLAIIDIDSTIMKTAPRNMRILVELSREIEEIEKIIGEVSEDDIGWNIIDFLKEHISLSDEQVNRINSFWAERFFTDEYLLYDTPYTGVKELIQWLIDKGISVIYLTGRDEPNMSAGTVQSFINHGLPTEAGTRFFFKPDFNEPDLEFKLKAMKEINEAGRVVLAVENEPGNANIIKRCCPDALVLLINTITSPSPEVPDDEIVCFDLYPSD